MVSSFWFMVRMRVRHDCQHRAHQTILNHRSWLLSYSSANPFSSACACAAFDMCVCIQSTAKSLERQAGG